MIRIAPNAGKGILFSERARAAEDSTAAPTTRTAGTRSHRVPNASKGWWCGTETPSDAGSADISSRAAPDVTGGFGEGRDRMGRSWAAPVGPPAISPARSDAVRASDSHAPHGRVRSLPAGIDRAAGAGWKRPGPRREVRR